MAAKKRARREVSAALTPKAKKQVDTFLGWLGVVQRIGEALRDGNVTISQGDKEANGNSDPPVHLPPKRSTAGKPNSKARGKPRSRRRARGKSAGAA